MICLLFLCPDYSLRATYEYWILILILHAYIGRAHEVTILFNLIFETFQKVQSTLHFGIMYVFCYKYIIFPEFKVPFWVKCLCRKGNLLQAFNEIFFCKILIHSERYLLIRVTIFRWTAKTTKKQWPELKSSKSEGCISSGRAQSQMRAKSSGHLRRFCMREIKK
jgi:hypothetical protein